MYETGQVRENAVSNQFAIKRMFYRLCERSAELRIVRAMYLLYHFDRAPKGRSHASPVRRPVRQPQPLPQMHMSGRNTPMPAAMFCACPTMAPRMERSPVKTLFFPFLRFLEFSYFYTSQYLNFRISTCLREPRSRQNFILHICCNAKFLRFS